MSNGKGKAQATKERNSKMSKFEIIITIIASIAIVFAPIAIVAAVEIATGIAFTWLVYVLAEIIVLAPIAWAMIKRVAEIVNE